MLSTPTAILVTGAGPNEQENFIHSLLRENSPPLLDSLQKALAFPPQVKRFPETEKTLNDPDIILLTPEKGSIGISEIRRLQQLINLKPISRQEKIAVVLKANNLTEEAQNALLKTLEEPPQDCIIMLSCQNPDQLLPTIISRCHIVSLANSVPEASKENSETFSVVAKISSLGVGQKFKLAAEIAQSREKASLWLDQAILAVHLSLVNPNHFNIPVHTDTIHSIYSARRMLKANTNVRLTIENMLLNW